MQPHAQIQLQPSNTRLKRCFEFTNAFYQQDSPPYLRLFHNHSLTASLPWVADARDNHSHTHNNSPNNFTHNDIHKKVTWNVGPSVKHGLGMILNGLVKYRSRRCCTWKRSEIKRLRKFAQGLTSLIERLLLLYLSIKYIGTTHVKCLKSNV